MKYRKYFQLYKLNISLTIGYTIFENERRNFIMDNRSTEIVCRVKDCEYHAPADICTATKIEVGGTSSCCSSCDTECVTFKPNK